MGSHRSDTKWAFLGLLAIVATAFSIDAYAARIVRIDVGTANLDGNGQAWNAINAYDVSSDGNSAAIPIGFGVDFGTGLLTSLFINENGFVSFGTTPVEFDSTTTDLTTLGGNVIAPYYADLTSGNVEGELTTFFDNDGNAIQSVSSSTGEIDPNADGDIDTPAGPTLPAFRVTWFDVGIPGYTAGFPNADRGTIQLVLFDTDGAAGGNFDIEFNYDLFADSSGNPPPNPLAAGYVLGENVLNPQYAGPFTPDFASGPALYHFCGGLQSATACTPTTPPTNVSEPGTLALMGSGIVLLALILVRRRARS